ncbi:hypothetical protein KIPB_008296 [Kipferlia bialata]|uniref:t-SNARE coiled-coil homology domain-containing protein n=1 Tax=Kipferlia bialata TaxID=797122 RepID=A0A9K3GKQ0_9EUKA|nr:hypothetical protein KIPB_008296 [Kipferlia bialata]|eukprot:g8296.t1
MDPFTKSLNALKANISRVQTRFNSYRNRARTANQHNGPQLASLTASLTGLQSDWDKINAELAAEKRKRGVQADITRKEQLLLRIKAQLVDLKKGMDQALRQCAPEKGGSSHVSVDLEGMTDAELRDQQTMVKRRNEQGAEMLLDRTRDMLSVYSDMGDELQYQNREVLPSVEAAVRDNADHARQSTERIVALRRNVNKHCCAWCANFIALVILLLLLFTHLGCDIYRGSGCPPLK